MVLRKRLEILISIIFFDPFFESPVNLSRLAPNQGGLKPRALRKDFLSPGGLEAGIPSEPVASSRVALSRVGFKFCFFLRILAGLVFLV